MIPHLVTGTLPGGLVVQVEGASPGLIGSNPAVVFAEISNHFSFPTPPTSPLLCWPWDSLGKLSLHLRVPSPSVWMDKQTQNRERET